MTELSIGGRDSASSDVPADASRPAIAQQRDPMQLTETELDHVTAAGSKPGMVGDGRQPHPFAATC
jgi:hypothetical protein